MWCGSKSLSSKKMREKTKLLEKNKGDLLHCAEQRRKDFLVP